MNHSCHALGCNTKCPPAYLMCRRHWFMVSPELRAEVLNTVGQRKDTVDESWAPWWRAQAAAVADVAFQEKPNKRKRDAYLKTAESVAVRLEAMKKKATDSRGKEPAAKGV